MDHTPIEAKRLKTIREYLGLTQADFARQLGLSTTADIERGKTRITGAVVKELVKQYQINPLWLYGESKQKHLPKTDVAPKVISLNEDHGENIVMVGTKAAAGYGLNIGDVNFYQSLPVFTFPLPEFRNATFRGFQITGDSMVPLVQPTDWVIAKAVPNLSDVISGQVYIVVEEESVRLKQVKINMAQTQLTLVSLNLDYPPVDVEAKDVLELWEYHSKITTKRETGPGLETIYQELQEIKQKLKA
jgi:transcriptional regulator with XRE-family HTH domain